MGQENFFLGLYYSETEGQGLVKALSVDFQLKSEFIELDNLLKATNLAASGAEARQFIQAGSVKVNGQVETRIRRKIRSGDSMEFGAHQISVVGKVG